MRIKWYGTASLLLESGETRILVDPHLKRLNPALPAVAVEEAQTASAIFITHPHFDHFSDVGSFLGGNVGRVYVSETGIRIARENGIPDGKMVPLAANEKIEEGAFSVRIFRSRHCRFDAATVLSVALNPATYFRFGRGMKVMRAAKRFKSAPDDIFALEFSAEGKSVMVLGSAGLDENTEYPENADLLVLPYQGRSRMHRYIVRFLDEFRPKRVMIDHFDNSFPPISRTVKNEKFIPAVKKALPQAEAFVPVENEWYEI